MPAYLKTVKEAATCLKDFEIIHVPHLENRQVDSLSKLANSSIDSQLKQIQWKMLKEWRINAIEIMWPDRSNTWIDPLIIY